jgi:outer membrane protein OmpA-like peptidoglycan-associated protein
MHSTISRLAFMTLAISLAGCAEQPKRPSGPPVTPTITPPPPKPPAPLGRIGSVVNGRVWSLAMDDLKPRLDEAAAGYGISVSRTSDNQIKVVIPADLGFLPRNSALGEGPRPFLDNMADALWSNKEIQVIVVGHTDGSEPEAQSVPLSLARARSVRDYLTAKGVQTPFLQASGRGAREPVAANETAAGRTRNRRIEILLYESPH